MTDLQASPLILPSAAALRAYMTATGWAELTGPGVAGSLWRRADYEIGVPSDDDLFLLAGAVDRVAAMEGREPRDVARDACGAVEPPARLTEAQCDRLRQMAGEWGDAVSTVRKALEFAAARIRTREGDGIIGAAWEALKVLESSEEGESRG